MATINNKYFVTPKGSAGYPKLLQPDTKFNAEGIFSTSLTLSAEVAAPLVANINDVFEDEFGAKKISLLVPPYKVDENGDYTFKFKSKSKPTLFDSKGVPVTSSDLKIGSGSTLKVKGSIAPTLVQGKYYATLWMNAVQIIDLVEFGGAGGGFGAEDGGFNAKDVAEDTEDTGEANNEGSDDKEDF